MSKEETLSTIKEAAKNSALYLQSKSSSMTADQFYEKEIYIPEFQAVLASGNMNKREVGFICKSSAGRVVKLIQQYDSTIYTQEPEELPAQWGFKWATEPKYALPFISISTSPYMTGDVCSENEKIYKSLNDNNVWAPSAYPTYWQEINLDGTIVEDSSDTEADDSTQTDTSESTLAEFVQPTGAHDAYAKGTQVRYNGKVYESLIDNNVYSPDTYPAGWKEIM